MYGEIQMIDISPGGQPLARSGIEPGTLAAPRQLLRLTTINAIVIKRI